ncbi:sodium/hydrogen exchanger 9B1 isoform X1 [Drosophila nasuta]|uniref:sodium/hydrogen exchanger 9B1 isoform X1 n=3 Tax=Drosophila nasuta TaxID=42062 RepID=UPI00295E7F0B|nr:sodium/hydrogen exchanger 9B1 isoform X1 [Drosophila nasuta]
MIRQTDLLDTLALNDGPILQSFRRSAVDEFGSELNETEEQVDINKMPVELLRRASETATNSIMDMEPENEHLLSEKQSKQKEDGQKRPSPPPRANPMGKGQKQPGNGKRNQQQQQQQQQQQLPANNRVSQSDNMPENPAFAATDGDDGCGAAPPAHTKLDIQKFPEEYNNGGTSDVAAVAVVAGETQAQNAATIILTPTSLNLTNTTPNAPPGGGGGSGNNNGNSNRSNTDNGTGYNTTQQGEHYKGPKWWRHFVLHWSLVSEHAALLVIFLGLWALGFALLPEYAIPSTAIMRIILLFVGAQISGILVSFMHLPDMLGMLFFGVVYTNVGLANFEGYERFELFLREMALINIMLLAGLGLDGSAFRRLWLMILRLTLVPTIVEVAIIAILAYYTLSMPWLWGIALGLVITAVSPNVVVTVMLKLKEDRLGLNSGIHTLIYAMTTCNDVVAIFMFGVIISVIFSSSSLTQKVLQGPIGIGIGLVFGYLYGMMLHYLPSRNAVYANGLRFGLTILGGTIAVMGSRVIGFTSAGALGCVMMAFIAGIGWKRQELKMTPQQLEAYKVASVPKRLDLLWKFLKPVSFALIGKEINFNVLDGRVLGYGALLVLLGSLFRLAFAYLSTYGGNLSRKERAYITISGFPKATVQAALGPVALDLARTHNVDGGLALASNVLIISVLAIIFTAPLGAILMLRLAPFWLKHGDTVDTAETPVTPPPSSPLNNVAELTTVNTQKSA